MGIESGVCNVPSILKKSQYDRDLSPRNIHNIDAARKLRLKYDAKTKVFRDYEGNPIRDRFFQPL